jgi:hypothetical protein
VDLYANSQAKETARQKRNATFISLVTAIVMAAAGIFAFATSPQQLVLVAPLFIGSLLSLWLVRSNRHILGGWVIILVVSIQSILSQLLQTGLGYSAALLTIGVIGSIAITVFPRNLLGRSIILSVIIALVTLYADLNGSPSRMAGPDPTSTWIFTGLLIFIYIYLLARQFPTFALRTKIILGVLITGGVALAISFIFLYFRVNIITQNLSTDLAESVKKSIESDLSAFSLLNANLINSQFLAIRDDVSQLAAYRGNLENKADVFGMGTYWDARTNLIQLPGGQYSSLPSDQAAVFIPSTIPLTDPLITELNISSYLDINATEIMKRNPVVGAVYYITNSGATTYYPNIGLASIVPPDFNTTAQNFFTIATPQENPKKLPVWTNAYQDPAGIGLIVTIAAPVYQGNTFLGVMAADMKLNEIAAIVDSAKIGQTGYSFLLDKDGHVIAMPGQGYTCSAWSLKKLLQAKKQKYHCEGLDPSIYR